MCRVHCCACYWYGRPLSCVVEGIVARYRALWRVSLPIIVRCGECRCRFTDRDERHVPTKCAIAPHNRFTRIVYLYPSTLPPLQSSQPCRDMLFILTIPHTSLWWFRAWPMLASPRILSLSQTLFFRPVKTHKRAQGRGVPVRPKRRRGSLQRLSIAGLPHSRGAETLPALC
jgi:hypothetical protein